MGHRISSIGFANYNKENENGNEKDSPFWNNESAYDYQQALGGNAIIKNRQMSEFSCD